MRALCERCSDARRATGSLTVPAPPCCVLSVAFGVAGQNFQSVSVISGASDFGRHRSRLSNHQSATNPRQGDERGSVSQIGGLSLPAHHQASFRHTDTLLVAPHRHAIMNCSPCSSPNRRLAPDGQLALHRVNGESALAMPPARFRPTSPRHHRRQGSDAENRPVDHLGSAMCSLHTCASLRLRDRNGARVIGCSVTRKPLKGETEPRCFTRLNPNSEKQVVQKSWNALPFPRAALMGRAGDHADMDGGTCQRRAKIPYRTLFGRCPPQCLESCSGVECPATHVSN